MEHIIGVGLAGYRSFGHSAVQYVGPLGKVNLIAGQNNAGKSNLLRAIQQMITPAGGGKRDGWGPLDNPAGHMDADQQPRLALALDVDTLASRVQQSTNGQAPQLARHLTSILQVEGSDDLLWFVYSAAGGRLQPDDEWVSAVMPSNSDPRARAIQSAGSVIGGPGNSHLHKIIRTLGPTKNLPAVKTIPAFRQIQPADDLAESFNGLGLIQQVAKLQDPSAIDDGDRDRFDAIQDFVRNVLDDDGLTINIPHDRSTINVRLSGGRVLPLEHMGTGIHQVVILAAAATLVTDTLVCVEEPEIHLHPLLQRKLVRYLHAQTTNQYLIATHSAHMLDADVASIFHVTRGPDGASQVRAAVTSEDRSRICADLGYRASDLVQANAIIWVEGPSDRVYVRHWIQLADPDLVEGIHFSIMFYGGRLLNHLSADDPDVDDFISLRRLNRHVAILIDSDKTSPQKRINPTKRRVKKELDGQHNGLVWITDGYTIENYVPKDLLSEAIEASHRNSKLVRFDKYVNPLGIGGATPAVTGSTPDKLRIARAVVNKWGADTVGLHELRRKVDALVEFIHAANGLQVADGSDPSPR